MSLCVAIESHLAWPVRPVGGTRFAEKSLGGRDPSVRAQEKVYRLAVLIDCPVEGMLI